MLDLIGLKEVADFLVNNDDYLLVCHHDADGLCSGACTSILLERLNKKHEIKIVDKLDPNLISELEKEKKKIIFVDLGSGQAPLLENLDRCIIDHHVPIEARLQFNPMFSGYDGTRDISGAGACYLVAKYLKLHEGLAKIALIGALGDMQNTREGFVGLNKIILKDALEEGEVEIKKDISLYGRHSRPLIQFLVYATNPIFPGLTANEEACKEFLKKNNIPLKRGETWLYYCDLTLEEKKRLITALYLYGKERQMSEKTLKRLVSVVYELKKEPERTLLKDLQEFSTLLNACGRRKQGMVGINILKGDRGEYLEKGKNLLAQHRKELKEAIQYVFASGLMEKENYFLLDGKDKIPSEIIGTVAGMLFGSLILKEKPILGICVNKSDESKLKISVRATQELVEKGLHLGLLLRDLAAQFEGIGGGHSIAAGATIPKKHLEEFLIKFNTSLQPYVSKH
ncbi:MAG: DHH family phosphoesterase [archaeon]